jgi:hypothetical protein
MEPIQSILDIPFHERDLGDLLNLDEHRDAPELDYYHYGHARADVIHLEERDRREPLPVVRDALILTVLLSDFLDKWLPRLCAGERAVVLVLCNPHGAKIARPVILRGTPLYYAVGDVESWLDMEQGRPLIRLIADAWRTAD